MNITGQLKLFVQERQSSKGGSFKKFSSNISSKQTDGTYVNMPVDIIFNKDKYPEATTSKLDTKFCYDLDITNGFLIVREYEGKSGKVQVLVIYVNECTIDNPKELKAKKSSKKSLI